MDLIVIKNVDPFVVGAVLNGTFPLGQVMQQCTPELEEQAVPVYEESKAPSDVEPPRAAKRTRKTKETAAPVETAPVEEAPIETAPVEEAPVVITPDMLRDACKALSMKKGRDTVVAIIGKFAPGEDKVVKVAEADWPAFYADLREAADAA